MIEERKYSRTREEEVVDTTQTPTNSSDNISTSNVEAVVEAAIFMLNLVSLSKLRRSMQATAATRLRLLTPL